jgi:GH25 family lysozyme M1 (1,4-beta-N-acetylmuramidase)
MGDGLRAPEPDGLPPPPPAVCADGAELPGIDVSKWNDDIDWPTVAASGIEYAFVRVSDGTTHFDPRFDENWAESRAAGIHTGVYQFFRPNQDEIAQANLLLSQM